MPVLLEKSAQQIKNQAEGQRYKQHRNYRRIEMHPVGFIANISGQLSKPVQAA